MTDSTNDTKEMIINKNDFNIVWENPFYSKKLMDKFEDKLKDIIIQFLREKK